jgi:Prolipoprotein diacylglyceryl transferase.
VVVAARDSVGRLAMLPDRCARPTIGRRGRSSYVVCGVAGYVAGLTLGTALAVQSRLGIVALLVLALVPPATLLVAIALSTTGLVRRRIVFYENAVAALGFTALALAVTRQPLARGLDLAILGIGTFLAIGRVGCFSVACCHGRRARVGVRYGWDHAAGGYTARWVGVTLFPIQLVDGAASACAVAVGTAIQLSPHVPGVPLAAYACVYGVSRFVLEFYRGDDTRGYAAGVSEAQWTAVITVACVAAYRPAYWTLAAAAALVVAATVLVVARRSKRWLHLWLTAAHHLAEIDFVLARLVAGGAAITTSEGMRMSLAVLPDGWLDLGLSHQARPLSVRTVRAIARQLGRGWTVIAVSADEPQHHLVIAARVAFQSLVRRA